MRARNNYAVKIEETTGCSAFMAGALIGAGVALLLAPQSGTELRGMLSSYANRAKEDLLEKAEEVYDKGEEVVREAGRTAKEFAEQGAQQGQKAMKDAGDAAKEFVKQAQHVAAR
jgi:gas vesicle protein